ncbi:hypothetical protein [Mesorhizobium sp.]|uniref:hypothetical protein n=1 Tax=Mesorhizobium sp. TaxID=1871066 RepID=UPI00257EDDAF|nr:hypothetical protein [Mesorhizobium sp.]
MKFDLDIIQAEIIPAPRYVRRHRFKGNDAASLLGCDDGKQPGVGADINLFRLSTSKRLPDRLSKQITSPCSMRSADTAPALISNVIQKALLQFRNRENGERFSPVHV